MIKQRAVLVLISYLSTYIYYCDEQDPERLTNIFFFFFFFTILFSAACHVVLPIKLDAIKIILHLRVCCGRFFFLR